MTTAAVLLDRLRERGLTIAAAESLTGGRIVATLVDVPGASDVVRGGVVAYATEVKATVLGVDAALLASRGPVDPEVARQMADRVRGLLGADIGVSTTGVAGPASPDGQPVGRVHIGVAIGDDVREFTLSFDGDREQIRSRTVRAAIDAVAESLRQHAV